LNIDILAVSNRTNNTIRLYQIALDGSLKVIPGGELDPEMPDEVYGLCMYKSPVSGLFYVFVNNKEGDVEQWELSSSGNSVTGKIVRKLRLGSQVEGMVTDDELVTLYVGEEKKGIWKFSAEPGGGQDGKLMRSSSETDNDNIRFDIEGLAVYKVSGESGYLIASSQGNDSYAIFNRQSPHEYLGSFRIVDGSDTDGVQETDGLDVTASPLGRNFPAGMLVVQDGSNKNKSRPEPQNFKLVNWNDIARQFMPPLKTSTKH
jgi:3-phytase